MKQIFPALLMMASPALGMAQGQSGLVMTDLDKSVRPADDFYQFATGGWQKRNPLPAATLVLVVSTNWEKKTTNASTVFWANC